MQKDLLIAQFSSYGRTSGSELFLPFSTANKFVEACSTANIAILGVEFFHFEEQFVIPANPINAVDCSIYLRETAVWDDVVKRCNEEVMKHLLYEARRDSTQWYNSVLLERSEWEQLDQTP